MGRFITKVRFFQLLPVNLMKTIFLLVWRKKIHVNGCCGIDTRRLRLGPMRSADIGAFDGWVGSGPGRFPGEKPRGLRGPADRAPLFLGSGLIPGPDGFKASHTRSDGMRRWWGATEEVVLFTRVGNEQGDAIVSAVDRKCKFGVKSGDRLQIASVCTQKA
jgi:hypothetical protein